MIDYEIMNNFEIETEKAKESDGDFGHMVAEVAKEIWPELRSEFLSQNGVLRVIIAKTLRVIKNMESK